MVHASQEGHVLHRRRAFGETARKLRQNYLSADNLPSLDVCYEQNHLSDYKYPCSEA